MKRVLIVTRSSELPASRFQTARPNSLVSPFLRWRKEFLAEGFDISYVGSLTNLGDSDFDAIIVDRRQFSGDDDYGEAIAKLNALRNRTGWIVFLDSSASSADDRFEVIGAVDTYAKRHLLKNFSTYGSEISALPGHFQFYRDLYSLGSEPSRRRVPLEKKFEYRVKAAWSHAYSNFENTPVSRFWSLASRRPKSSLHSSRQDFNIKTSEIGALYSERRTEPFAEARRHFQRLLEERGGVVIPNRLNLKEYFSILSMLRVNVSPYGHGEYCIRDFETLWFGVALAKPTVDDLLTFPNVLIGNQTYLPLSRDPKSWLREIHESSRYIQEIAAEGHHTLKLARSKIGFLRFLEHFSVCLLSDKRCQDCASRL